MNHFWRNEISRNSRSPIILSATAVEAALRFHSLPAISAVAAFTPRPRVCARLVYSIDSEEALLMELLRFGSPPGFCESVCASFRTSGAHRHSAARWFVPFLPASPCRLRIGDWFFTEAGHASGRDLSSLPNSRPVPRTCLIGLTRTTLAWIGQ